jgi:tetratricopeptide (TPR) repeat protein
LWLGATSALFVATPLIPSEAAVSGMAVGLSLAWLAVLAAFVATSSYYNRLSLRIGVTDVAFLIFLLLHTVSALVMAHEGQPRQTLNLLWHWISFGAAFFLVRQLVRTSAEARAMVAVMIALAVCLSMHGYHQYFYSMPQARRVYKQNPQRALELANVDAPEGSAARQLFESRLKSTEPMATFTLANSLAGFLSPWMLCAIGLAGLQWTNVRLRKRLLVAALLSVLLIAGCWVLTKSRTATLATICGLVVLIVYGRRSGWRPGWKTIGTAAAAITALFVFATSVGGFDLLVLTESSKSLLYRAQYWRSTLTLIGEYPWFGCGPGNFQQYYTAYKLPAASETVSDPHNFLLEIWSTSGTLAFVAFVSIFVGCAFQLWSGIRSRAEPETIAQDANLGSVRAVYWGALVGIPLGFVIGLTVQYLPDLAILLVGVPVGAAVVVAWHAWVMEGELPLPVLVASGLLLLVNLLAAGGISFAGVSLTLWLLLALALNSVAGQSDLRPVRTLTRFIIAAVCVIGVGVCWYSAYHPVVTSERLLADADRSRARGQLRRVEDKLLAAAKVDNYAVNPRRQLAYFQQSLWLDSGAVSREVDFRKAAESMISHNRRSNRVYAECGGWFVRAFHLRGDPAYLEDAIEHYRRAVELYPNYNLGHARLAWTLHLAGKSEEAAGEAAEALRLDGLNPHHEQKLALQTLGDPQGRKAEPLMHLLRNSQESPSNAQSP